MAEQEGLSRFTTTDVDTGPSDDDALIRHLLHPFPEPAHVCLVTR